MINGTAISSFTSDKDSIYENKPAYNVKISIAGDKKNYKCIKLVGNIQIILDIAQFFCYDKEKYSCILEEKMNTVCRDIFRAIHENKWLSIEYKNKQEGITKYWIGLWM